MGLGLLGRKQNRKLIFDILFLVCNVAQMTESCFVGGRLRVKVPPLQKSDAWCRIESIALVWGRGQRQGL